MIYNYRSLDNIVKKNQGKLATFNSQIIENKKKSVEDHICFLSFYKGDRIRFYHYQDVYEHIETCFIGKFYGWVNKIELIEFKKDCFIETRIFVNGIICAIWKVYGKIEKYEPIDWEITKNYEITTN